MGTLRRQPRVVIGETGVVGTGLAPFPPGPAHPTLMALPWSGGRLGLGRFWGLGLWAPGAGGGAEGLERCRALAGSWGSRVRESLRSGVHLD